MADSKENYLLDLGSERVKKSRSCQTVRLYLLYLRPTSWDLEHFLQNMECFYNILYFSWKNKDKEI